MRGAATNIEFIRFYSHGQRSWCGAGWELEKLDHDVGGFDEGGGGVATFELHLADGVGGDDGGDALVVDGEDDLGHEAVDLDVDDFADELVASADLAVALAGACGGSLLLAFEEGLERGDSDAVVTAGGGGGGELAREDPLLDGGVADVDHAGGLAGGEEGLRAGCWRAGGHGSSFADRRGRDSIIPLIGARGGGSG